MTLQDMRDFVRDALDTDSTDLGDDLLDRYILDGSNRVESYSDHWSFRAVDYTFTTIAGTQAYDIRSDGRVVGITLPLLDVVDVRSPNWSLKPRDHQKMRKTLRSSTPSTANPTAFTEWADSLYLWPIPDSAIDISITGYRQGLDWVSDNPTSPDFPAEFHEIIAWWALNRGHAREGDPQMADFYRSEFADALKSRSDAWVAGVNAQPLVMGESVGASDLYTRNGLGPLIYPFE